MYYEEEVDGTPVAAVITSRMTHRLYDALRREPGIHFGSTYDRRYFIRINTYGVAGFDAQRRVAREVFDPIAARLGFTYEIK